MVEQRSRGQLILVAAVLIALVIVAAAVLLNGLVAPESATTAALTTDATDLERSTSVLEDDLHELFLETSAPADGTPLPYAEPDDLETNVNQTYNRLVANQMANRTGSLLQVGYVSAGSLEGTLVYNQTADGDFTNGTDPDWTMASNVDPAKMPRATYNVTPDPGVPPEPVRFVVDDTAPSAWAIEISDGDVTVNYPSRPDRQICDLSSVAAPRVEVEAVRPTMYNATVTAFDGSDAVVCQEEIVFADGISNSDPWELSVENGDQAVGTYAVAVVRGSDLEDSRSGDYVETAENKVIDPTFRIRFLTEGITYESTYTLSERNR